MVAVAVVVVVVEEGFLVSVVVGEEAEGAGRALSTRLCPTCRGLAGSVTARPSALTKSARSCGHGPGVPAGRRWPGCLGRSAGERPLCTRRARRPHTQIHARSEILMRACLNVSACSFLAPPCGCCPSGPPVATSGQSLVMWGLKCMFYCRYLLISTSCSFFCRFVLSFQSFPGATDQSIPLPPPPPLLSEC